eukprot:CAMPEP_0113870590 /NCGR_PEP_ID=MMETSP0780_2-20120614/2173_1 /TAXON_ID=652834 /ORGANISM="Palpitomonas bilix" /LENGTH=126 /DNA_ID=CAMNT_0000855889 /DNA_START=1 /DNA_END=378 /DNA_ORIENTATION=- /assembly_acc=CAM_ASM_000599
MTLKPMKALVAAETIRIVGQMDGPDEIVENLFLGNEYNASDVSKLKSLGIKRVVNVTLEIKNFFPSEFEYMRIAVLDTPNEDLLSRFSEVIQFIDEAIDHFLYFYCSMVMQCLCTVIEAYRDQLVW